MKAWSRSGMLRLGSVVWMVAGAGCISVPIPQAEADPARFYVLNTVTPPGAGVGGAGAGAEAKAGAIYLQPVEVASYLRSRPMIVRRGENEIQFREFARWGEPLELGIARVLREELLARGAAREVRAGVGLGAGAVGKGDVGLVVRVLACEGAADGSVIFRAVWELTRRGDGDGKTEVAGRGEYRATNLRWDGKSEGSLAAQLSAAVAGLAGEVAGAVGK